MSDEDYEKIESQVIVILNSDIFDLKGCKIKKVTKENNTVTKDYINPSALQEINTSAQNFIGKEKEILALSETIKKIYNS